MKQPERLGIFLPGVEALPAGAGTIMPAPTEPPLHWLLTAQAVHDDGTRSAPEVLGLFSSPDHARHTARLHPDLTSHSDEWTEVKWDHGRRAYRTRAESHVEGEVEQWELWIVPLLLDEPVLGYHEDRARFEERYRADGGSDAE